MSFSKGLKLAFQQAKKHLKTCPCYLKASDLYDSSWWTAVELQCAIVQSFK